MVRIYEMVLALGCVALPMTFAAERPSVSDLIDRYAANQDKLSSYIAKTEDTVSVQWSNQERPDFTRMLTEVRIDGGDRGRSHIFYRVWEDLPTLDAPTPTEEARNWVDLWDAERAILYYYRIAEGRSYQAEISRDERRGKSNINIWHAGVPFLGIRFSDYERIDSVLRQAKTVSVRNKLEQVGSGDCYVIDAKAASGTYTLWIDPQHGYQIAQAEIHVGPNDRYRKTTLKENESDVLSVRNVRFESIDGIWIPMEADIHWTSIRPGHDQSCTIAEHHKITQITLNPDHEALGSFVPAIANGTPVFDRDFGIKYTWQDGKLIPDVDEYTIDQIHKMAEALKDQGQVPPGLITPDRTAAAPNDLTADANGPTQAKTVGNEGKRDIQAQSRSLPMAVLIVISLSIIVAVGLVVLRRPRTSEK